MNYIYEYEHDYTCNETTVARWGVGRSYNIMLLICNWFSMKGCIILQYQPELIRWMNETFLILLNTGNDSYLDNFVIYDTIWCGVLITHFHFKERHMSM